MLAATGSFKGDLFEGKTSLGEQEGVRPARRELLLAAVTNLIQMGTTGGNTCIKMQDGVLERAATALPTVGTWMQAKEEGGRRRKVMMRKTKEGGGRRRKVMKRKTKEEEGEERRRKIVVMITIVGPAKSVGS